MAQTGIILTHSRASDYQGKASMSARDAAHRFERLLTGCVSGSYPGATGFTVASETASGTVTFSGSQGVQASGTVTLGGDAGDVTVVIGGFSVGPVPFDTDDTVTALAVAIAIGEDIPASGIVTASAAGDVVTITAIAYGTAGNAITLTASRTAGTATASGATLAGGTDNTGTITINGVAVAEDVTGLSDTAAASLLAASINAETDPLVDGVVTATSSAGVVTISAAAPGVGGNAITLAASGTGLTASGARLTGGASTSYTF